MEHTCIPSYMIVSSNIEEFQEESFCGCDAEVTVRDRKTFNCHSFSPPWLRRPLSHVAHVIQEMVTTERSYVRDLSNIIEVRKLIYFRSTRVTHLV